MSKFLMMRFVEDDRERAERLGKVYGGKSEATRIGLKVLEAVSSKIGEQEIFDFLRAPWEWEIGLKPK